jgi:hypothetical protein
MSFGIEIPGRGGSLLFLAAPPGNLSAIPFNCCKKNGMALRCSHVAFNCAKLFKHSDFQLNKTASFKFHILIVTY